MKYTNNFDIPEAYYLSIINDNYDVKQDDQNIISVSTLISPPRIRQLTIRHYDDIEVDVLDVLDSFIGTCVHSEVEKIKNKNYVLERRLRQKVLGIELTGKPDIYKEDVNCIEDNKVTKPGTILREPGGKLEWIQQLNCYALLSEMNGIKVKELQINVLLKEWNRFKISSTNYPQQQSFKLKLPLWPLKETAKFINERIELHLKASHLEDKKLPQCTAEEKWNTQTYKLYKNKNIKASKVSRNLDLLTDYKKKVEEESPKDKFVIKKIEGEDMRCNKCIVRKFCSDWLKDNDN